MLADHLYGSAVDVFDVHLIVRRLEEKKLEAGILLSISDTEEKGLRNTLVVFL